jgi:translation initiation factor IF-1
VRKKRSNKKKSNGQGEQKKKDFLEMDGVVTEVLPAATFRVQLQNGHEVLAHLAGRLRMYRIRLLLGDKVKVQMTPYDLTKGRILYRY